MKYKRKICAIMCSVMICIAVFGVPVNAMGVVSSSRRSDSGQGIVQLTSEKGQPKVISVVLDNSSSMVKKDGKSEHTTRWIEADYTVKALAAMMDTDDILRLYIMSGYRSDIKTNEMSEPEEIRIGKEKEEAVKAVEDYLEKMKFCQYTYYQGVTRAAEDMEYYLNEGRDCWIVILTDGVFWEKGEQPMDAETLTRNLHDITASGAYGNGRIRVAYIPIGDKGETADIKEDIANEIYVANVEDGGSGGRESLILKKVTDTINRIYGRVRLERQIEEKYLPREGQDICFRYDIPLERLIIFMQHSGAEESYEAYRQRQSDSGASGGSKAEINIGDPSVPAQLARSDEADFEGRDTLPDYEDEKPNYTLEKVRYKKLWGKMLSYIKRSVSRGRFESQELVIPVNSENRPDVEIYYQPAIKVGLEYVQNGESVRHIEGCLSSAGRDDHEEYCLQEGPVVVRIKLLDDNGNEIPDVDSGLLYKDRFSVCLRTIDGTWQPMESTGTDYEFRDYLEQQDYQIMVITPWDEQKTGVLKVQERRKKLEILPLDIEKIMLNESEDGASLIKIRVDEDGVIPPEETTEKMTVECTSQDERLVMVPLESDEPGTWLFEPMLRDPRDHLISQEVQVQVFASRPYVVGEPETAEAEITLPISSYPEVLSVCLESEKAVKVRSLLWPFGSEKVPLMYLCRDILDEEEKARVSNQDFHVEPDGVASYLSMGEDGNLYIKRSFIKWFFSDETSAEITFHASYDLWNTQNEADVVIVLEFHIISAWVRCLIEVVTLLMIFWVTAILFRNSTYRFIRRFRARLLADVGPGYTLKQDRLRHLIDPFCNCCSVLYINGRNVENPIMPDLRLQIRNNRFGAGYEIVNYTDFADPDRYTIMGRAVGEDNRIIDDKKKFAIKDNDEVKHYLMIER